LAWQWADFGATNTKILVDRPRAEHQALIAVVDAEGQLLTSQSITFTSPEKCPAQAMEDRHET
jgi:hypothetical protein